MPSSPYTNSNMALFMSIHPGKRVAFAAGARGRMHDAWVTFSSFVRLAGDNQISFYVQPGVVMAQEGMLAQIVPLARPLRKANCSGSGRLEHCRMSF
jgi:hypothetical protein